MKKIISVFAATILASLIGCSVSPKNGLDQSAKAFLSEFQKKLEGSNEEILALFLTNQNKNEILKAIEILRNSDTSGIRVLPLFEQATASWVDTFLRVEIPLEMQGNGSEIQKQKFFMKLFQRDGRYHIGGLEADEMYKQYILIKAENDGALARRMADAKIYYDKARELQKNCDTIVWYVHHKNMTYYYAVNGSFNFDSLAKGVKQDYKMGLLDENGIVIVPIEFDLIGNPSIGLPDAVEVSKGGKVGYYGLTGKLIVPAAHDWLIPYQENETQALVKNDSSYGWLDKLFVYHRGFPSVTAEQSIKEFGYLTTNTFSFGAKHNDIINVLYPLTGEFRFNGSGVVVPPAYFVKAGLFSSMETQYLTDKRDSLNFQYGTEYVETKSRKPFNVTETIDAFISEFKSRFVGGRQEFYMTYKITLVDKNQNVLTRVDAYGDHDFQFRKKTDSLYESRATYDMGGGFAQEFNFPSYVYYRFDGRQFTQLSTHREFAFTEFIKMDSSYLTGDFAVWDSKIEKQVKTNFVGTATLGYMRNEILASYGFIFSEAHLSEWYGNQNWYTPITDSYDEVYNKASEIDKYNLDFLNRMIGAPEAKSM
ncbi:MAG TPA: YARHG domain-containing protein [Cyclobacteriaceae bacterium]|jgi:hypothetical protein|nr:YARHG domain-containing protein [Cyclobacteriaceae bacterium]